ncbi:40S ribosomal protein SA [Tupaia chinensis]|uniref:40S ribosomal protein SA n=1 Tax=Tupaia chinensis TaxID=246437 RepID=L9L6B2_TUPCH|nr:40S ribosomal protein SA [Tupaia chinensis]
MGTELSSLCLSNMHSSVQLSWTVLHRYRFYSRYPNEAEILKRWERKNKLLLKKAVTKEEFQGVWTAPAPAFTAARPEAADRYEGMQEPSVPIQQFPPEGWALNLP